VLSARGRRSHRREERHLGGGAHLWKNIEAAKLAHGPAWRAMINDLYGSEDQISVTYFETPVVADNLVHQMIEEAQLV
jgi:hypothetical protein